MININRGRTYTSLHIHAFKLELHIMLWKKRFWERTFKIEEHNSGEKFLNAGIAYIDLKRSTS